MTRARPDLRVAIVHDWLTGMRGGERVLQALCRIYPDATVFTLVHTPGSVAADIERHPRRVSFVGRLPGARRSWRHFLPIFPLAVEQFDLDRFDLVLSSSHCAVKSVVRPGRARHLCYCHSPMRYAWDQFDAYFGPERVGPLASALLRAPLAALARWDAATAGRVDRFLANSQHVAGRIRRYYNREAVVVYPPVDTDFYTPGPGPRGAFFLAVSALVPYKRLDVAIRACQALGAPLIVVGDGPERDRLKRIAGPETTFLGRVDDDTLRTLYRQAAALVMPGEEDFGMVPVEAQACACPVVAVARGGALETVDDDVSGVLVEDAGVDSFADGLEQVRRLRTDPAAVRARALRFSQSRFDVALRGAVDAVMAEPYQAEVA